jgi:ribosomal protein S18 acetylase RimI-like enzyme
VTLPSYVKAFWYACIELGERTQREPWGAVATDRRYPLVWEANLAAVMEPDAGLDPGRLRAALLPALRRAAAPHEHVEFWETSVENPALAEFRRNGERPDPDEPMVFEGPLPPMEPEIRVDEFMHPPGSFWPWYRDSLREFGMKLSEPVLDQMLRRTQEVLLPAGMRWFVASVDGEHAGYASLISLERTGYIENVVTMPAFRRRGVASAAVAAAVRASQAGGDDHVFLLTEWGGDPQRMYRRLGFRVAASIESFTRSLPPEDAA